MNRFSGNRGGILKVLLIIFGVLAVCMIGTGIYIAMHWRGWVASAANLTAQEMVKESGLPDDQREAILTEIRQLTEDFKIGKIGAEQIGKITKAVTEGPLIPLAGVQAVRQKYIEPSAMTPDEKAAALLTVQRYARGVYEKKIPSDDVKEVAKPIAELRPNGSWRVKDNPTRVEIDQFLANAKARADAASIPEEPFDLNIADELHKAIHVY